MNRIVALSVIALASLFSGCASLPPLLPFAGDPETEPLERGLALLAGVRDFSGDGDFGDTEVAPVGGVELWWQRSGEPLAFELALQESRDSEELPLGREVDARVSDLQLGLRYHFARAGVFQPYLGGGLALLYARSKTSPFGLPTRRNEDWDTGLYAHAGAWAPLGEDLRVGFDLRWLTEDWLGAGDFDLDHTQLAVTLGTGF